LASPGARQPHGSGPADLAVEVDSPWAHHFILFDIKLFHGFGRFAFGLRIDLMWEPCGKKSRLREFE
jgi:hypothetical protein